MLEDAMDLSSSFENKTTENPETELLHKLSYEEHEAPISIKEVMLTTSDNPFDPFVDFDLWFRYDSSMNYNSCNYLARIAKISDELSDADNALAIEQAVDEIVQLNLLGNYKKIHRLVNV